MNTGTRAYSLLGTAILVFLLLGGIACADHAPTGPVAEHALPSLGSDEERLPAAGEDRDWMSSVNASIAASERQPAWRDHGVLLTSRSQGLRGTLEPDGALQVSRRSSSGPLGAGDLSITLRTTCWGRGDALMPASLGAPRNGDCLPGDDALDAQGGCVRRVELPGNGLNVWWGSAPDGLEQGWTLDAAPAGSGPVRIGVEVDGAVVEVSGDRASATLKARATRLRYDGLRAWDATGVSLEAWLEGTAEGMVVVFDDEGAEYPVEVDPFLSSTAAWTAEPDQQGANFGRSVASAGDVNGDGYDDVVVGAWTYDNGETNEGAAFLYLGSASGLGTTADWMAESDQAGALFGYSVATAGDINDDGYDDLIVGAEQYDNGETDEGAAFLFLGSASGLEAAASWMAESDQAAAFLDPPLVSRTT